MQQARCKTLCHNIRNADVFSSLSKTKEKGLD